MTQEYGGWLTSDRGLTGKQGSSCFLTSCLEAKQRDVLPVITATPSGYFQSSFVKIRAVRLDGRSNVQQKRHQSLSWSCTIAQHLEQQFLEDVSEARLEASRWSMVNDKASMWACRCVSSSCFETPVPSMFKSCRPRDRTQTSVVRRVDSRIGQHRLWFRSHF